ncbi:MAG: glutathione S-transferase family protein [Rhodobiaceae bacterium]|nr:glutathione S-transferase family protein [Rhodobiaceae bacterium]MCC0014975.1 glutathione S-transferase family protein [Rhodobiaceae bacterium]MCC0053017.1 glutathione S-transferase family protein [Rhodobiaceae bacterium]
MTIVMYDLAGGADCRFSPYCWRARMALAHKGLAVETRPTRFAQIAAIGDGSQKTVPVIDDRGTLVSDSFAIAQYLETTYPDAPSLFGGAGGEATARFVESWANAALNTIIIRACVQDIHDQLHETDQPYFRASREKRFGQTLEQVQSGRDLNIEELHAALLPLRLTLRRQAWIGGDMPLFADHIVFGSLQWARVISKVALLKPDDPVAEWFGRCLDLYGGVGAAMPAAA